MAWFKNHYRCSRCKKEWSDEWLGVCEDNCSKCGTSVSPYKSEETPLPQKRNSTKIAELNDTFRKSFCGGRVVMTANVAALPGRVKVYALLKVSTFEEFNADNDPYGEHDFGSFKLVGRMFFWKIDYYDSSLERGSENPADSKRTARVLTLMLAEDY
jgi:hypothetical protein